MAKAKKAKPASKKKDAPADYAKLANSPAGAHTRDLAPSNRPIKAQDQPKPPAEPTEESAPEQKPPVYLDLDVPPAADEWDLDFPSVEQIQGCRREKVLELVKHVLDEIHENIVSALAESPDAAVYQYPLDKSETQEVIAVVLRTLKSKGFEARLTADQQIWIALPQVELVAEPLTQANVSKVQPL